METGTYWGYTSTYLASAAKATQGTLYTIDTWPKAGRLIPPHLKNHVVLLKGNPSSVVLPELMNSIQPDFFFQDSDHSFDVVKLELETVYPALKPGGLIALPDFLTAGVEKAVEAFAGELPIWLVENDDQQGLAFIRKPM